MLLNYLRTYRKRSSLTQDEVGYLLGGVSGSKISRYEQYKRLPSLETLLAYEAIFRVPVKEMFAGFFQKVEKRVVNRVGQLGKRLLAKPETPRTEAKLEALSLVLRASRRGNLQE